MNSREKLIGRLEERLPVLTGLKLSLLSTFVPASFLALLFGIFLGPIASLASIIVPGIVFINFLRRDRQSESPSWVVKHYRARLYNESGDPLEAMRVHLHDPNYTSACYRALYTHDIKNGWIYMEPLIRVAIKQEGRMKWDILNEVSTFISYVPDSEISTSLEPIAWSVSDSLGLNLSLKPPPSLEESYFQDRLASIGPGYQHRRLPHDLELSGDKGEVHYKAAVRLSRWIRLEGKSKRLTIAAQHSYNNKEIIDVISAEVKHLRYIMEDTDPQWVSQIPNAANERDEGLGS